MLHTNFTLVMNGQIFEEQNARSLCAANYLSYWLFADSLINAESSVFMGEDWLDCSQNCFVGYLEDTD